MASQAVAEILGLDAATTRPSAYQLLGLPDGEDDPRAIEAAYQAASRQLKQKQTNSDPQAWKQAAAAIRKAGKLLTDPQTKAAYDAKRAGKPRGAAASDPLEGLLPRFDALAPFDVQAAAKRAHSLTPPEPLVTSVAAFPTAATAVAEPPPAAAFAAPEVESLQPTADPLPLPAAAPTLRATPPRRRRRRGFPWATAILSLLVVGMLGGIAAGIYLLAQDELQVAEKTRPAPPVTPPSNQAIPTVDPVMGTLIPEATPPTAGKPLSPEEFDAAANAESTPPPAPAGPRQDPGMQDPGMDQPASPESLPSTPAPAANPQPTPEPTPEPTSPSGPSPAEVAAGNAALQAARQAILQTDWATMVPATESAVEAAANDSQQAAAARYAQLADLATYYYEGLLRGIGKLEAGDQIELENIGTVGIIEANETTFAIQVSGRPKQFAFAEIPFFVLDAIADLAMNRDDPTTQAARAVYQAISPRATPEHRQQSIAWLAALPAELQDAESAALQQAIEDLYPQP